MRQSFTVLLVAALFFGCATKTRQSAGTEPAVAAAVKETEKLFGWKEVIVDHAEFANGIWSVTVSKIPQAPGRFIVFKVTSEGKILGWKGGS